MISIQAIGDGIHDDTTAINSALSAAQASSGDLVINDTPGNYLISAPLIIGSNTTLYSAPGVVYTLTPGSNCNMLQNAVVTPQRSVADAAITAGSATLISNTANFTGTDIGRTVSVAGAWAGYPLIANITAVNSATSVTLSVLASATVSGASCSIYNRDSNIEVIGGYWQRGSNGYINGVSSPDYQTTQFRHVDGIIIRDLTVACAQRAYQISLGDVTNYAVSNITSVCSNSIVNTDVVNVHGPAQFGRIDAIYGTNGDDFVSIHSVDGDSNLADTVGNISDLVVSNLFPNEVGQAAFKAHAGASTTIQSLTVRSVHGSALAGGVHLQDYASPSDSNIGDVLVEDVDVLTNGTGLVNIACNNPVGVITLKNLVWRQANTGVAIVDYMSGSSLQSLVIDGLQIEAGSAEYGVLVEGALGSLTVSNASAPDSSVQFNAIIQVPGSVNSVALRNVTAYMQPGSQNALVCNKNSAKSISIDDIYLNGGGIVFLQKNSGTSNSQVLMSNIVLDGAYQLAQLQASTADFSLNNLNVISQSQNALIALSGSGANFSVRGKGLINSGSYTAFSRDGTQKPRIVHAEMQVDVSQLAKNNGDLAYNTNSSLACGVGPAMSNGSHWKNLYSGNTY